ncbi:MAG TPA: hypothetical protein VNY36_07995, partial [Bacteroidia bacterium]|nr:hypothetical protein [Bacteroidia bacterium]
MIKQIFHYRLILLCLVIPAFESCNHNSLKIDVSGVNIPRVKIERLEKDMFAMPKDSINKYTPILEKKYGRFYDQFVIDVINDGGVRDSTYNAGLKRFITDNDIRHVYDTCEKIYPDMAFLEAELTDAFKHYKYYFPDKSLPKVVTAISGFNYALAYKDSTLAISLDMYMGKKSPYYIMLRFPEFKIRHMSKDYMLCDAVYGWLQSVYKPNEDKNDMLAAIVHEGKIRYLEDALLPELSETTKMWYTGKQLDWCKENEFNMWAYLIEKRLVYSTDQTDIIKFTDDGPFTAAFNHDYCPSRVGHWL